MAGEHSMRPSELWREQTLVPRLQHNRVVAYQANQEFAERLRVRAQLRASKAQALREASIERDRLASQGYPPLRGTGDPPAPTPAPPKHTRHPRRGGGFAWLRKAGGRVIFERTPNPERGHEQYKHHLALQTSERRRRNKEAAKMRARQRRMS